MTRMNFAEGHIETRLLNILDTEGTHILLTLHTNRVTCRNGITSSLYCMYSHETFDASYLFVPQWQCFITTKIRDIFFFRLSGKVLQIS